MDFMRTRVLRFKRDVPTQLMVRFFNICSYYTAFFTHLVHITKTLCGMPALLSAVE